MTRQKPLTPEQEQLNEIFAKDPALYNYIMFYEEPDNDPYTSYGDYDERGYLQGDYDDEDHILTGDLDVLQAIGQRQEYELLKMAEDDPVVRDYLRQCEEEEAV